MANPYKSTSSLHFRSSLLSLKRELFPPTFRYNLYEKI